MGGFLAEWNRTHLFNPNWPPHATFHNAQSILLGASGLYFLWRRSERPGDDLAPGALPPSFLWFSRGDSFPFPGAGGLEIEFPEKASRIGGVWLNERVPSTLMLALLAIGYPSVTGD